MALMKAQVNGLKALHDNEYVMLRVIYYVLYVMLLWCGVLLF